MAKSIQGDQENLLQSKSKLKKRKYRKPNFPPKTKKRDRVESGLHNNAPKRVTMHIVAAVKIAKVKGFHSEPKRGEDNHNGAPKRVTRPAGITIVGAEALSFRPEKSLHVSREISRPSPSS
jgi:hypothetical protein